MHAALELDRKIDAGKPRLQITRRYAAPREKVFRAWTDPAALSRWMVPNAANVPTKAQVDLRVGGAYRIEMTSPSGEVHVALGLYRVVDPPSRLVFTWGWPATPERVSLVTVVLREAEGGTELTLTHEGFFDAAVRDSHEKGWTQLLGQLEPAGIA